ncbi:MAG: hypothetical protein PHE36_00500 [Novosphingobium sp.]|nr:hypothetical protein [Novosphingobium sp.]
MKKIAYAFLASAGALALSACGSSDSASEDAQADTVEMPADEAMTATTDEPVADADATTDAASDAADKATDAASDAADAAADAAGAAASAAAADAAAAAGAKTE